MSKEWKADVNRFGLQLKNSILLIVSILTTTKKLFHFFTLSPILIKNDIFLINLHKYFNQIYANHFHN